MIVALDLPFLALTNAIALTVLTALNIKLSLMSVIMSNIFVALIFIISIKPYLKSINSLFEHKMYSKEKLSRVGWICIAILGVILVYAVVHTLLPTFHYDSLTNWNIRSKVSFYRSELVFDTSGSLIEKPHYPPLFHALQITAMQFMPRWIEAVANGITLMLTSSLLLTSYLLLRVRQGRNAALTTMTLIAGMPLLTMHTGQGYADLLLVGYALVSLLLFECFIRESNPAALLLSGVMVSACVWTKTEGLFFCLLPWLTMCSVYGYLHRSHVWGMLYPLLWTLAVSLLWPIFALWNGYGLTPHSTDSSFSIFNFQFSILQSALSALFVSGSFGITWYAISALVILTVIKKKFSLTLLWGVLSFVGYMAVYLFTENVQYLLSGQAFDRQMLLPAALLLLSLMTTLHTPETPEKRSLLSLRD